MKTSLNWAMTFAAVLAATAQVPDQIQRATIRGSGGTSGKCTIEVRVDGTAEIDIYGDSARLRTLAGQPASWVRMDCNNPLPYNMSDFRFRGIDGRGSQQLVRDPRNNNSIAVIRIEDPRSGSEGYTFDIEWSGASGGYAADGFRSAAYSAPATGVSGVWNVVFNGRTPATLTLQQNGSAVTGNLVSPDGTPGAVTGQISGNTLSLSRNTGMDTIQHYQVTIQGESFSGTYRNEGRVPDSGSFTGSRISSAASGTTAGTGGISSARRGTTSRAISFERALDLCRAEVHTRGQSAYGLRSIDITSVGMDTAPNRRNWVTGTFTDGSGSALRSSSYRFNCSVDFNSGQVSTVEFLRADGSALPPASSTGAYGSGTSYGTGISNQAQVLRACQDAVVARVNQSGYQNVQFEATAIDTQRPGWVSGSVTASRLLLRDTFDFSCSMDFATTRVLNVQVDRR